jgi:hypothetical protein
MTLDRRHVLTVLGGGIGGLLTGSLVTAARADTALDIQILQTASSLEVLALGAYDAVLGTGSGLAALSAFATEARRRHDGHKRAFQSQTTALGGRVQEAPNPKFQPMVVGADLTTPAKVVEALARLERVAADTYLVNLPVLEDSRARTLMAGVMAVTAQHLATLRLIGLLLGGGSPQLVSIPFPLKDLLRLPTDAGSVATPDARHTVAGPELIAEPASGAVR